MDDKQFVDNTLRWIKEFIIAKQICPFAEAAILKNEVGIKVLKSDPNFDLVLKKELQNFVDEGSKKWSTYFMVIPFLHNYDEFLEVYYVSAEMVDEIEEIPLQLVAFHPNHLYSGVDELDTVNFANRSPYPLIQILKKDQLDALDLSNDEKEGILQRNENLFSEIGFENLIKALDEFRR